MSVIYKVYNEQDEYVGVIDDVISDIQIENEINSLGMAVQLTLARNADSTTPVVEPFLADDDTKILTGNGFPLQSTLNPATQVGPGSIINHNYRVEVIVGSVGDDIFLTGAGDPLLSGSGDAFIASVTGDGATLYTGFISGISTNYGGSENTVIQLVPYGYDADQFLITDDGDTTVTFNSTDPSDILKEAVDQLYTATGMINYDTGTIVDTETVTSYTFNTNTIKEVISKCLELAPSDFYYYLDPASNIIYFQPRPAQPDHYFFIGKHIETLDIDSTILEVVNDVVVSGGDTGGSNLFIRRTEAVSAGTRRSLYRKSDNRLTVTASAEIIADGEIERNNQVLYRTTVEILAATYNISNIRLGQLVGFRNAGNYVDDLELQVLRTRRSVDKVELELGTLLPKVNKRIEDIRRNLILQETENNPTSPS